MAYQIGKNSTFRLKLSYVIKEQFLRVVNIAIKKSLLRLKLTKTAPLNRIYTNKLKVKIILILTTINIKLPLIMLKEH